MIKDITNLKQLKELVIRYETITFIEIYVKVKKYGIDSARSILTKIASRCILCENANKGSGNGAYKCSGCFYYELEIDNSEHFSCISRTYSNIWNTITVKELFHAYRERAKYIRQLLVDNNINI